MLKKGLKFAMALTIGAIVHSSGSWAQQEFTLELPDGATIDFVWVAPGTFTMGRPAVDDDGFVLDSTERQVTISRGYWLGKYEITQAQWESVMGDNQSHFSGPNLPADSISWFDVQDFVIQLNQAAGDSVFRMPTEAEWEYAARAGTTTRWAFGDDINLVEDYAWFGGNAGLMTHEVGSKLPNAWGFYDMYGNVWEWVQDWHSDSYYKTAPSIDPPGPEKGFLTRVLKSCFFNCGAGGMVPSGRSKASDTFRFNHVGGRILRMGEPPTAIETKAWGQLKRKLEH